MNKTDKGYDNELINELIAILQDEKRDIDPRDFNKLQSAIKEHCFYDRDETEWDDVEAYVNWDIDAYERNSLLGALGVSDNDTDDIHDMFIEVKVETLADFYRMELLLKMYKQYTSIDALENAIRVTSINKISNVVL